MTGDHPISAEAAAIKRTISPEVIDPAATVESDRQAWIDAVAGVTLPIGVSEVVEDIGGVACRWISPSDDERVATILYAHGGGLVAGSSATSREFAARLALATVSDVLLVDYRLLPEHGIADPIEDVASVYRSLMVRVAEGQRSLVFAGDSSGAALMVATLVAVRDAGDPLPAGLISFSGAFDATLSSPSIDEGRDPQLDRTLLEHWQDSIRPVVELDDPRVSPLFAELHGLPPMLLLAGSDDAWRDDSVRLAERLVASEVSVELEVANGMWHVWPMSGSFPEADAALERAAEFIRSRCS